MGSYTLLICIIGLIAFVITKDRPILRVAICSTGTADGTYYLTLSQKGSIKCSVGTRRSDNIKSRFFLSSVETSSKEILTAEDLCVVVDLLDSLEGSNYTYQEQIVKGGWKIYMLYKGSCYKINWGHDDSEEFSNVVNKIVEISPIVINFK